MSDAEPTSAVSRSTVELREAAAALNDAGESAAALPLLQMVVDRDPEDAEAWTLVSQALTRLDAYDRAQLAAEYAAQADRHSTPVQLQRCRAYLAGGSSAVAFAAAVEALDLTYFDPEIRRVLARLLLLSGQNEEAARELQTLRAELPDDLEVACLYGDLYRSRKQVSHADLAYRWALEKDPKSPLPWVGLAELNRMQARYRDAAHCYSQAAKVDPFTTSYRREVVQLVDKLVEGEEILQIVAVVGVVFVALILWGFRVPLPLVLIGLVAGSIGAFRGVRLASVSWILHTLPEARVIYHATAPAMHRQETTDSRDGCLILLGALGLIWGAIELSRRGWWEAVLQGGLVGFLGIVWTLPRLPRGRRSIPKEPLFYFPGEERQAGAPSPESFDSHPLSTAWSQIWDGQPSRARETARRVLAENVEEVFALEVLALAQIVMGEADEAVAAAISARKSGPDKPSFTALVWLALAVSGRSAEAGSEAKTAPGLAEAATPRVAELATALLRIGAKAQAQAATRLVVLVAPESAEARALDGEWAASERRWRQSEVAYRQALALKPDGLAYLTKLGEAVAAQHRLREAQQLWNQALRLEPTCKQAVYLLGKYAMRLGIVSGVSLCGLMGIIGMAPTFAGAARNSLMPWMTFSGGLFAAGLGLIVGRCALWRWAPAVATDPQLSRAVADPRGLCVGTWARGSVLLLTLHAIQAWLEILLHRSLVEVRWQGAVVISFLALYLADALWEWTRPKRPKH